MLRTNKNNLIKQAIIGKISHPTMLVESSDGFSVLSAYVTTCDGKPKIGFGLGGIKYNVRVGDSCFGWPETEYLEPGVSFMGLEDKSGTITYVASATSTSFYKLCCVGNEVEIIEGIGKGVKGIVTGKAGYSSMVSRVHAEFSEGDLEKLTIGDKGRVISYGIGLEIESFDGRVFNMSPNFLESLGLELKDDRLQVPVVTNIPAFAMGMGSGGGPAETGHWCIQTSPPELVDDLKLRNLRIGDLVSCRDVLMSYGKGYYKGAISIGIVAFGASDQAGQGIGVFNIISSMKGKIDPVIDRESNVIKYLGLRRV